VTLEELLRNAKSFGQGASNSAASTVSGPVDMLAALLRKGGMTVNNPVAGEQWMRENGLTAEPENKMAGQIGEGLGNAGAVLGFSKASEIARLLRGGQ